MSGQPQQQGGTSHQESRDVFALGMVILSKRELTFGCKVLEALYSHRIAVFSHRYIYMMVEKIVVSL